MRAARGTLALALALIATSCCMAERGETATRTFAAVADTYTRSDMPDTSFGTSVRISAEASSPMRRAYLRFALDFPPGGVVKRATLHLHATTSGDSGGVELRGAADSGWTESTLTYNSAPSHGVVVSRVGSFSAEDWIALDALPLVSGPGSVAMALTTTSDLYRAFDSRESGMTPTLQVETIPGTAIESGPTERSFAASSSATFAFSATEAGAVFECRLDERFWTACPASPTLEGLADGLHVLEVRAVDASGADPTAARRTWTVDTVAPDTALDGDSTPRSPTASTTAETEFSTDEAGASFECRLDDAAFGACIPPLALSGLDDGEHRLEVRAVDRAGNVDPSPAAWTWTVDTTAPAAPEITVPQGGAAVGASDVTVSGTAERASLVRLFADEADAAAVIADAAGGWEARLMGLLDGPHLLIAVAVDAAGNSSAPSLVRRFTVDTLAPQTAISAGPGGPSRMASPSFSFTSDEPDASFECRLDDGAFTGCVSPNRYSRLGDGPHTFVVRAIDRAGNVDTTPDSRSWTIDTVVPTASITGPASGTVHTKDGTIDITAAAADDVGVTTVEFWDGGIRRWLTSTAPYRYRWKIGASQAGRHRWTVRTYDAARNVRTSAAVDVDVNIVNASVETDPVPHEGDSADDPAVWVHPTDPGLSTIIGTDKVGDLAVYDLAGTLLYFYPDSRPNNVDLRYGFPLAGESAALAATTDRATNVIRLYRVDVVTRGLVHVGVVPAGAGSYGVCMYRSAATDRYYVFVTYDDGSVRQWHVTGDGAGGIEAEQVRRFAVPGFTPGGDQVAEGCVADDELGAFYVSEEDAAIWRFGAEPDAGTDPVAVDVVGDGGHLVADVEGLALYTAAGGLGYLIASSQGSEEFAVYERGDGNRYIEKFGVGRGVTDPVSDTDGIDVVSFGLGAAFAEGVLVVQDDQNFLPDGTKRQNFKLVPWGSIARGLAVPLLIDSTFDPRIRPGGS